MEWEQQGMSVDDPMIINYLDTILNYHSEDFRWINKGQGNWL